MRLRGFDTLYKSQLFDFTSDLPYPNLFHVTEGLILLPRLGLELRLPPCLSSFYVRDAQVTPHNRTISYIINILSCGGIVCIYVPRRKPLGPYKLWLLCSCLCLNYFDKAGSEDKLRRIILGIGTRVKQKRLGLSATRMVHRLRN